MTGRGSAEPTSSEHGELDVGERLARPALRNEERALLGRHHRAEHACIDEADPCGQRVDAEGRPGQVQEGQRRQERHLDTVVSTQQLDAAFSHERRSGHGIDDRLRILLPPPPPPGPPRSPHTPRRRSPRFRRGRRTSRVPSKAAPRPDGVPCGGRPVRAGPPTAWRWRPRDGRCRRARGPPP